MTSGVAREALYLSARTTRMHVDVAGRFERVTFHLHAGERVEIRFRTLWLYPFLSHGRHRQQNRNGRRGDNKACGAGQAGGELQHRALRSAE